MFEIKLDLVQTDFFQQNLLFVLAVPDHEDSSKGDNNENLIIEDFIWYLFAIDYKRYSTKSRSWNWLSWLIYISFTYN